MNHLNAVCEQMVEFPREGRTGYIRLLFQSLIGRRTRKVPDRLHDTSIASLLDGYRVANWPLYLVGSFDTGVTVFSQQVRALNLALALIETRLIPSSGKSNKRISVAIVGAGFAGLTFAKALFQKWANVKVTLLERRDTLLPLQHGSDTRWLHPRIYDWPAPGSNANAAMLPVLNWVAARASDVVVQVLKEWKIDVPDDTYLFCNTKHLQIHPSHIPAQLQIEWVGERRKAIDGTQFENSGSNPQGRSEAFDIVILTSGFGLERDETLSYWRNDNIGQPILDQPRKSFIVSGQGDGAVIDLLRLRISLYRQDRILNEIFQGQNELLEELRTLQDRFSNPCSDSLYRAFENLENRELADQVCQSYLPYERKTSSRY